MKLAGLSKLSHSPKTGPTRIASPAVGNTASAGDDAIRDTAGQDHVVTDQRPKQLRKKRLLIAGGSALALLLVVGWMVTRWSDLSPTVTADRLRVATVVKGQFVRDVAAQGTVIAAVNPTLFATAAGTVSYVARAGDAVKKGQLLATLDSPELSNEFERERATLHGMEAALVRQEIEIRRQQLASQQQADLAQVKIQAAERELKRAQWAWDLKAISERDYLSAKDDVTTARLNFDSARDTAGLERDSLALDLKTRRLDRDRQSFLLRDLERRVNELKVLSPVDGMVGNLAQAQQAKVAESAPLVTVVDLTAFEIEFQVAETYARDIKPGMTADIMLDGQHHKGTVAAISPEVRQSQVTGRVKFTAQPASLRQNQRTNVRIVLDEREGVLKFERGAQIDETSHAVYVIRGDRAVLTPVELGSDSVSEVEVLRGLAAGDRVIISDTRDFKDAPELSVSR